MGFFDRRVTNAGAQNAGFQETLLGTAFKAVWRDKTANLPDPGAQSFAYETYGLVAFPPSGPSIVANSWRMQAWFGPPSVSRAGLRVMGIPTVAGQFFQQPLLDPYNSGPVGGQV